MDKTYLQKVYNSILSKRISKLEWHLNYRSLKSKWENSRISVKILYVFLNLITKYSLSDVVIWDGFVFFKIFISICPQNSRIKVSHFKIDLKIIARTQFSLRMTFKESVLHNVKFGVGFLLSFELYINVWKVVGNLNL